MRVGILEFLDTDVFHVSDENCVSFLDPLIESWDIDFETFGIEIILNRRLMGGQPKRFEFVERGTEAPFEVEPGLEEFLNDTFLSGDATEEEIAEWPMPSPDDSDYSGVSDYCESNKECAIYVGDPGQGDVINKGGMLRGAEQSLVDLIAEDPAGMLLTERRTDIQREILRRTLEAAKGGVDFLWMGEDLGTQRAPLISLELYRKH